jgi:hypothetical protein
VKQASGFSQGKALIFPGQSSQNRDANAPEAVAGAILARASLKKSLKDSDSPRLSQTFQFSLDGCDHHGLLDLLLSIRVAFISG